MEDKKINNQIPINTIAEVILSKRNGATFQELLDVMYYSFLLKNKINTFAGIFKDQIYVHFESIFNLLNIDMIGDNIKKRKCSVYLIRNVVVNNMIRINLNSIQKKIS